MITFEFDTGKAQQAVKSAERRELPVPQEIYDTAAMVDVVLRAAHMQPPERPTIDDIPATPDELAAIIAERAHQHRIALAHQAVGTDYLEPIAGKFNRIVREQVPGWIRALQPEFNGLVKQLRTLAKKLPDNISRDRLDWNSPAVSTPWTRAEGIAFQLDQIVNDRKVMAQAGGLTGEGGKDNELYAVAELPEPTEQGVIDYVMRDHISPEIQQWRELKHSPVPRWIHLARSQHLTIQLATPDEVRARAARRDEWVDAIATRGQAPEPSERTRKAIRASLRG